MVQEGEQRGHGAGAPLGPADCKDWSSGCKLPRRGEVRAKILLLERQKRRKISSN
jgi:hypothetical protein